MKGIGLQAKLLVVLGLLAGVAVAVACVGLSKLGGMNDRLNAIVDLSAEKVKIAGQIKQDVLRIGRAEKNLILADSVERMTAYADEIDQVQKELGDRLTRFRSLADAEGKAKLDEFTTIWNGYLETHKQVRAYAMLNSNVRARMMSGQEGRQAYDNAEAILKALATLSDENVSKQIALAGESAGRVKLGDALVQDLLRVHRAEKNVILEQSPERMKEYDAERRRLVTSADQAAQELRQCVTDQGRPAFEAFAAEYERFKTYSDQVCALALEAKSAEATTLSCGDGRAAYDKAEEALQTLVALNVKQNAEAAKAAEEAAETALTTARVVQDMLAVHRAEKNLILETSQEGMDRYADAIEQYQTAIEEKLGSLDKITNAEGKARLGQFRGVWAEFTEISRKVRAISRENGNNRAFELATTKGRELADASEAVLTALVDKNIEGMEADKKTSDANYASARFLMLSVSVVGILVAAALGLAIIRGVVGMLKRVFAGLRTCSTAELESAAQAINQIIDGMTSGSAQVSMASTQLAEGSSEQASSLEETSASLEEIAATTKQNAAGAEQAKEMALVTRNAAQKGKDVMSQMSKAMADIKNSSDETAKILKTIDEIAFQTNLLALNAAVEAARAGEAGKGFAVVAEEVRNLAQRSAEAARNTGDMIEESIKNSERGVQINDEVAKALEEIAENSTKLSESISQIASASQQQSQGVSQVNIATSEMDKVTQSNAATAEELNAQAEELNSMIVELEALFRGSSNAAPPSGKAGHEMASAKPRKLRKNALTASSAAQNAGATDVVLKEF
ncbi:MAG: hypothetical protein GXY33_19270 [Phycisphaerae bacterium]|nr:hypothetical protein [Phycisphaerae bacterium]